VWGGGVPSPLGKGKGDRPRKGAVPLPHFLFLSSKRRFGAFRD